MLATSTPTLTRVNNSYVDASGFNGMTARLKGGVVYLNVNIYISNMANNTAAVKIGTISTPPVIDTAIMVPAQGSGGHALMGIEADGDITIANYSGATISGFFRTSFAFPAS